MIPRPTGGGGSDTSTDDTSSDDGEQNIVPTGALNPTNYEVEDTDDDGEGELQEETVGGNTIADVVDSVDYEDTATDEQAETSDDPQTTEEIIDEHSNQGDTGNQADNSSEEQSQQEAAREAARERVEELVAQFQASSEDEAAVPLPFGDAAGLTGAGAAAGLGLAGALYLAFAEGA